jgi:hypothetical protein
MKKKTIFIKEEFQSFDIKKVEEFVRCIIYDIRALNSL